MAPARVRRAARPVPVDGGDSPAAPSVDKRYDTEGICARTHQGPSGVRSRFKASILWVLPFGRRVNASKRVVVYFKGGSQGL
ncbi:MAG: hypothetical protein RBR13_08005 [Tenuifilaceae bacterium]|nr:hypothetical protein [Tenuifilaceae bacterium]